MDLNDLRSLATVLMALAFAAIAVWAWSSRRKADFDAAAQLPFADDLADEGQGAAARPEAAPGPHRGEIQ